MEMYQDIFRADSSNDDTQSHLLEAAALVSSQMQRLEHHEFVPERMLEMVRRQRQEMLENRRAVEARFGAI